MAGPRRTGKTSVCEAALTRIKGRGIYVAAVDLFELADAAELAEALATAVLRNRPALRQLLPKARRLGRSALTAAQAAAAVSLKSQLGEGVELALTPGLAARDPQAALVQALELPERVALADGKRCVVFFDEFQELASDRRPYGDPDAVTKRMRATFQRSSQVSYLFTGSLEHVMRDLFTPQHRALSGFGTFFHLGPIAREDWVAGLHERLQSDGCQIGSDALERIVTLGECHPRVTMLIAQQTHFLSVLLDRRRIDLDLVQQGYNAAYAGDSALIDQLIETIRSSHRLSLKMARRVATQRALTEGMHRGDADRALKKLIDAGIIERLGRGNYRVINPLLRRRLAEQMLVAFG
ncbi:MAG: hypothetical protein LC685_05065 [Actinobacteria bacterium]|nr:hypothetical protein [Actinomycetota bacterium]